jgi:L-alanine-DL-glutamate epimerase-like enolase superfamily enzyme
MVRRLSHVLAVRAAMLAAAEAGGVLATRHPAAAARLYGAWTLATAFGFAAAVLAWIAAGAGPGGRLLRLDPSWAPTPYPPALRRATEAMSASVRN